MKFPTSHLHNSIRTHLFVKPSIGMLRGMLPGFLFLPRLPMRIGITDINTNKYYMTRFLCHDVMMSL